MIRSEPARDIRKEQKWRPAGIRRNDCRQDNQEDMA
jgi:hypothetical protein